MKQVSTRRFIGVLACIILLFSSGAILLLQAALRPGLRVNLDIKTGKASRGANTSLFEQVTQRLLRGRLGLRSLELMPGGRVRLERLQLALGDLNRDPDTALINDAELEVDVPGLRLHGLMDIGDVAQKVFQRFMSSVTLVPPVKIPAQVLIPLGGLESLQTWSFSTDLSGQGIRWEPLPLLAPIPFKVDHGRVSYAGGNLDITDLRVSHGGSSVGLNLKIVNINKAGAFQPSNMEMKLDLAQVVRKREDGARPVSKGFIDMNLGLQGPMERPTVSGKVNGSAELPFVPLAVNVAGWPYRSIEMGAKTIRGTISGGSSADDDIAVVSTAATKLRTIFHSAIRTFGYSSETAQALMSFSGTWKKPKVRQALTFENGVVNYGFNDAKADPNVAETGMTHFPYQHLGMEIVHGDTGVGFKMVARRFLGGDVTSELAVDMARKPKPVTYTFNGLNLSLDQLFNLISGPAVSVHGDADIVASGEATGLAFLAMQGKGTGTLRGFSIDWHPKENRQDQTDVADLLRRITISNTPVEYPVFGCGVYMKFRAQSSYGPVLGKLGITRDLNCDCTIEYNINPAALAGYPVSEGALRRLGYNGRLLVRIAGLLGKAKVEVHTP